jgi:antitoxin MazE
MEATIRKWGNSPAVRLTASTMKAAAFDLEQKVVIKASRGRIVIEPVKAVGYTLEALVSGITDRNLHQEVDFGSSVGRELL